METVAHPFTHMLSVGGVLIGAVALILFVRNRVIRRRLLFSTLAALAMAGVHFAAITWPWIGFAGEDAWRLGREGWRIEALIAALAVANALIALLFNPWFRDGESDRAPSIVQDTLVVVGVILAGTVIFRVSSFNVLAGSTVVALLAGFALQETLSNAFAGIALQMDRPFRVGHWITVGERVGLVTEMTWRATKIRTKAGNTVAVPNSVMAREAINNYSEPTAPTRLEVEVGATYDAAPNAVRAAMLAAAADATFVLASPAPDVIVVDFADSAITYRIRFWVEDFSRDDLAKDSVRTRIYYEFKRRGIEIPWPIQIQYERDEAVVDRVVQGGRFATAIAAVPVLAALPGDAHQALAAEARELTFADGEAIVREGDPGASMFVVLAGRVIVTLGEERRQVATTTAGGYFGEMSLLTGDARTATVSAHGDCTVLEITTDAFREYVQRRPEVIEVLAAAATARRRELDEARATTGARPAATQASLTARMRQYFGLH